MVRYAFGDLALRDDLLAMIGKEIGAIAAPDVIRWAPGLPKMRSGKITRRLSRTPCRWPGRPPG